MNEKEAMKDEFGVKFENSEDNLPYDDMEKQGEDLIKRTLANLDDLSDDDNTISSSDSVKLPKNNEEISAEMVEKM